MLGASFEECSIRIRLLDVPLPDAHSGGIVLIPATHPRVIKSVDSVERDVDD